MASTQTTRVINGEVHAGTSHQLDLYERYVALKGKKVNFPTERGERRGVVSGYSMCGGGDTAWRLQLEINYRNGRYWVFAEQVSL